MQKNRRQPVQNSRAAVIAITTCVSTMLAGSIAYAGWHQMRCDNNTTQPTWLSLGIPSEPYTVLIMGTDVLYSRVGPRKQIADHTAFTGRSDVMMLVRIDPNRRTIRGINIPRDIVAYIPEYGYRKINAANAIGGPLLAALTVRNMLGVNVDHYLVLNTQGLVDAVNELGGVTVEVPKKLSYMDWTAKLKIDLEPGVHTLTGNQAMGFVRFRHDHKGDIGRIQRQQIFIRAAMNKMLLPANWQHIPALVEIGHRNLLSDLSDVQLFQLFNLVRSVPKDNIQMSMLPGHFGNSGDWVPDGEAMTKVAGLLSSMPDGNVRLTPNLPDRMME